VRIKNLHSFYKRKRDDSGEGEGEGEEGADPFDAPPVLQLGDLGQQRQEQEAAAPQLDEPQRQEDAEQQEPANQLDEDEVPGEAHVEPLVAEDEEENQTNEPIIFRGIEFFERDPALRPQIWQYPVDQRDQVRRAYLQLGLCNHY